MNVINKFKEYNFVTKLTITIIIFAILLRFIIAAYTIEGGDPCYHASAARFVGRNFRFPLFEYIGREIFAHEPLFHIFGGFFYYIFNTFGQGDLGIHMVSPIFGSLSIILTFFITRKLFDNKTTLFAVIFISFLPLSIYHSTTAHIDMVGAFFALLSVYLMLKNMFYLSSISFGLSLLGRINSIFIAPVIIYLIFKKHRKRIFVIKFLLFFMLAFFIITPWYLRNYALLHNPVWPFLNSFFGGYYKTGHDFKPDKLNYILDFKDAYLEVHLALFGVPDGKYSNLFIIKTLLFKTALLFWLSFTLISLTPLFFFNKKYFKDKKFQLLLWASIPYIFFLYFYQYNYGNTSTRYILGAIPFVAIIWALGVNKLIKLNKKITIIFLITFIIVFSASETLKTSIISYQWKKLDNDIKWIKNNSGTNATFLVPGQCLGYRLDRPSFPAKGTGYNLKPPLDPNIGQIDYIFNIDNIVQGPIKNDVLSYYIPYFQKIYENNKTNVAIYKRK